MKMNRIILEVRENDGKAPNESNDNLPDNA